MATGSVQPLPPPPPPPPPSSPAYAYPPIIIVLTIVLLIFFFVGFFSIYFCRCLMQNILCTWNLRHSPSGTPVGGANPLSSAAGLDPAIVQSFPIFAYSTVKDYRKEKYGLECAICLLEFQGIDILRLLPSCCHVFHQECIDLWLESHKTCPVCRRNLNTPAQSPVKLSPLNVANSVARGDEEAVVVDDSVSITIKDEENGDRGELERGRVSCSMNGEDRGQGKEIKVDKFSRSHSTGHSIVRNREEEDRFTLRLPEHVRSRIIRGHNSSKSWAPCGDYKDRAATNRRDNVGLAEVAATADNKV